MFEVGEKVSFLYESGTGVVLEILNSKELKLLDDFGFEQKYFMKDLVKIHGTFDEDLLPIAKDDEVLEQKSKYSVIEDKSSSKEKNYWELDLHIESITEDFRGLSNFEIMKLQMQEFKRFFSKAKANQIQKIVVIHGVGEGVLKNEIRSYLAQQEFLEFYDASYLEYGKGATEIRFFIPR